MELSTNNYSGGKTEQKTSEYDQWISDFTNSRITPRHRDELGWSTIKAMREQGMEDIYISDRDANSELEFTNSISRMSQELTNWDRSPELSLADRLRPHLEEKTITTIERKACPFSINPVGNYVAPASKTKPSNWERFQERERKINRLNDHRAKALSIRTNSAKGSARHFLSNAGIKILDLRLKHLR